MRFDERWQFTLPCVSRAGANPKRLAVSCPLCSAARGMRRRKVIGKILRALAGSWYDAFSAVLVRWANEDDPPVRRVGDSWFLLSREDTWSVLDRFVTRTDLERLGEQVQRTLGVPDPKFDLPAEEQWWAAAKGAVPHTSEELNEALAETLAMLGSRGNSTEVSAGATAADYAEGIVRKLLERANADWRIWASLSEWRALPLLAAQRPTLSSPLSMMACVATSRS